MNSRVIHDGSVFCLFVCFLFEIFIRLLSERKRKNETLETVFTVGKEWEKVPLADFLVCYFAIYQNGQTWGSSHKLFS